MQKLRLEEGGHRRSGQCEVSEAYFPAQLSYSDEDGALLVWFESCCGIFLHSKFQNVWIMYVLLHIIVDIADALPRSVLSGRWNHGTC